jgi:hypothetical protein
MCSGAPGNPTRFASNSAKAEDDPSLVRIVGRHFHLDPVTDHKADKALAHFAGDVGENHVTRTVVQFDAEHGSRENFPDRPLQFNGFGLFRGSIVILSSATTGIA